MTLSFEVPWTGDTAENTLPKREGRREEWASPGPTMPSALSGSLWVVASVTLIIRSGPGNSLQCLSPGCL